MAATVDGIVEPEVEAIDPAAAAQTASIKPGDIAAGVSTAAGAVSAVLAEAGLAGTVATAAGATGVGTALFGVADAAAAGALTASGAVGGGALGSAAGVLGSIAGAASAIPVAGWIVAAGAAVAAAFTAIAYKLGATTPGDAGRFLYEIDVWPLKAAKLVKGVSPKDLTAIRLARFWDMRARNSYGLETVQGWLEKVGEPLWLPTDPTQLLATTNFWNPADPVHNLDAQKKYFEHLAAAYVAMATNDSLTGKAPEAVTVPGDVSLVMSALGPMPAHHALDQWLQDNPAAIRQIRNKLVLFPNAWNNFHQWTNMARLIAGITTPDPVTAAILAPAASAEFVTITVGIAAAGVLGFIGYLAYRGRDRSWPG